MKTYFVSHFSNSAAAEQQQMICQINPLSGMEMHRRLAINAGEDFYQMIFADIVNKGDMFQCHVFGKVIQKILVHLSGKAGIVQGAWIDPGLQVVPETSPKPHEKALDNKDIVQPAVCFLDERGQDGIKFHRILQVGLSRNRNR